jgi:hypothetical protein
MEIFYKNYKTVFLNRWEPDQFCPAAIYLTTNYQRPTTVLFHHAHKNGF